MIKLLVVSDNKLYRESLVKLLDKYNHVHAACTEEYNFFAFNERYGQDSCIVLIDIAMNESCKVIAEINHAFQNTKIIAIAMTEDENSIFDCAKMGVAGYLTRNASLDNLINAVNSVSKGELFCPRKISEILFNKIHSLHSCGRKIVHEKIQAATEVKILFTQREKQIVSLLIEGKSNKEIARVLAIELSTVKNHVHNILSKMGVRTRTHAMAILQNQEL